MYLRFGSTDEKVKEIQASLEIEITGVFDRLTEAAVKNFQLKNNLPPTGVGDPSTLELLVKEDFTTDISERVSILSNDLVIEKYYLPPSEYMSAKPTPDKKYIFIHHTAGSSNPYNVIDGWARDSRGRVATQYVIGSSDSKQSTKYDGLILEAFPSPFWAGHLGAVGSYLQSHSIGIELCNWGPLTEKNGKFYTYTSRVLAEDQVIKLKEPFRGFSYFHSYTDEQLDSLKKLLLFLSEKYDISLKKGLQSWMSSLKKPAMAFEYFTDAYAGKAQGLLSHTNVRKDKTDVYPHPKLIELIKSF